MEAAGKLVDGGLREAVGLHSFSEYAPSPIVLLHVAPVEPAGWRGVVRTVPYARCQLRLATLKGICPVRC